MTEASAGAVQPPLPGKRALLDSIALAGLAGTLLLVPVLVALLEPVPDVLETPIPVDHRTVALQRLAGIPIELEYDDPPRDSGQNTARLAVHVRDAGPLAAAESIQLLVATHGTRPRLLAATLLFPGGRCRFESEPGSRWPNNSLLTLHRVGTCEDRRRPGTSALELVATFEGAARLAVWTYGAISVRMPPHALALGDPGAPATVGRPWLRGSFLDHRDLLELRRIDLLAAMWEAPRGGLLAIAAAGWCAAVLGAGLIVRRRGGAGSALAAGLLMCGLASVYAVLIPPFQTPDEPAHLLGLAQMTGNERLEEDTLRYGRATHYLRIRFHTDQKFRPADAQSPLPELYDVQVQQEQRSALFPLLARFVSAMGGTSSAPEQLLRLRVLNALIVGAALATAALVLGWVWEEGERRVLALLVVPSLPFFAIGVSNYSLLVAAYVVLAAGIAIAVLANSRSHLAGPLIGLSMAGAIASARSAAAMLPLIAMAAAARMIWPPVDSRPPGRAPATFWGGMAAGVVLLLVLAAPMYLAYVAEAAGVDVSTLLGGALLAMLTCGSFALVERRRARAAPSSTSTTVLGAVAVLYAAALLGGLVLSIFVSLPTVTPVERANMPDPLDYVVEVFKSAIVPFRIRAQDHLLGTTFWGAFGWMDTPLPAPWLAILAAATATGSSWLLLRSALDRDARRCLALVSLLTGVFASVLLCALLANIALADVHGRYLIGMYLPVVLVAFSPLVARHRGAAVCVLLAAALHGYTIQFLLRRYF